MGYYNNTPLGRRTISDPQLRRSIDDATVIPQPYPPPSKKIQKFLNKLEKDPNPMTRFGARYQNLTNYKQFLSKPTIGEKVKFLGKRALYSMAIGAPVAAGMGAISGGVSYVVREGLTDKQNRARAEAKELDELQRNWIRQHCQDIAKQLQPQYMFPPQHRANRSSNMITQHPRIDFQMNPNDARKINTLHFTRTLHLIEPLDELIGRR